MKRLYYANASDTPPQPPKNPSYGYPQDGDRSTGKLPTTLGAWWHHMITEEFMAVIEGAGLEPDENNLHQLADIFEDFRQRAAKAEVFAEDAQGWADKAKEYSEATQTETDAKIAQIREAGEAQIAAVNAATAASQEEIDQKTAELEEKLQTLIAALDAKGGEQVNLVKQQAQEILDAIELTKNQVEELVNSAGYSMRWLADAHEGENLTAALTPSTNVKVGDHVINSSGEIFELIELRGTEIVLGPVLAVFGDVGPAPEIDIEVVGLAAGETPTVAKSGTKENPLFTFGLPKGEKGDRGDVGPEGPQGIPGSVPDAVLYSEQTLSEAEQRQARTNIGAAGATEVTVELAKKANASDVSAELAEKVSVSAQQLSSTQQTQVRTNIGFSTGIEDYWIPILKAVALDNGVTQAEIDALEE